MHLEQKFQLFWKGFLKPVRNQSSDPEYLKRSGFYGQKTESQVTYLKAVSCGPKSWPQEDSPQEEIRKKGPPSSKFFFPLNFLLNFVLVLKKSEQVTRE